MNTATLDIIIRELAATLTGRRFGRVFQLSRYEFAFDMRLADSRYLYIDAGPADPKLFLIRRRLRDLERSSGTMSPLALQLRKRLSGATLTSIERLPGDRVVKFAFEGEDETGASQDLSVLAQLTGKSANLFLVRDDDVVLDRVRETLGDGQMIGETYRAPTRPDAPKRTERDSPADRVVHNSPDAPSEALDTFYAEQAAKRIFEERADAAIRKTSAELSRREKLVQKLNEDLARHGEADQWKHLGDVLLANVHTAKRIDGAFVATDYFDENVPEIAVPAEDNQSVTEAAEHYFRRYAKARNAVAEITGRLTQLTKESDELKLKLLELEEAKRTGDANAFGGPGDEKKPKTNRTAAAEKRSDTSSTARSFRSSDGFEILVGKKAKDNDVLTFKLAKSLDTWLHAADYPGSHVVIRNPNRVEIPPKTLLEAAQLAAFYSQGKSQTKAAVNYTQKKFVNKPKGAPPGLVSLSSFKTILVEPGVPAALEKE